MYSLYHNKSKLIISIEKANKWQQRLVTFKEEITPYNDNYFFCLKRKPLKEKALEIKQDWLAEAERNLQAIKDIKV